MSSDPVIPETGQPGPRSSGATHPDPFADLWAEAAAGDVEGTAAATATTEAPAVRSGAPVRPRREATAGRQDDRTGNGRRRPTTAPASRGAGPPAEQPPADTSGRARAPIRARQVQRIVRRVDAWTVLKTSLLFYLTVWLILLLAGSILWIGAASTGMIDNVETFIRELGGWEVFEFNPGQLLRGVGLGGLLVVIFGSVFTGLLAVVFNLIADLTGGIRLDVVEVERARRSAADQTGERRRPG